VEQTPACGLKTPVQTPSNIPSVTSPGRYFLGFIHLTDVVTWHLHYIACQSDNLVEHTTSEQGQNRADVPSGQFQKGISGNPGGRPRVSSEVRELAQTKAPRAFEQLVELMESTDQRVAMAASNAVLDRAYGKPSPEERTASFAMRPVKSAADVVEAISDLLTATVNGEVSITDAKELASVIEAQRKAIETNDLEARLKRLEEELCPEI